MMWTSTDWFVFGAIVTSFAILVAVVVYLHLENGLLRQQNERLTNENNHSLETVTRLRTFIFQRDRENCLSENAKTQVIDRFKLEQTVRPFGEIASRHQYRGDS